MYEYLATVIRVVDGDTVSLRADLGMDVSNTKHFRLAGIDAPERGRPGGTEATAWLTEKLKARTEITIKTSKDKREKHGRYLAEIYLPGDATSINQQMIEAGHAVAYDGGKR